MRPASTLAAPPTYQPHRPERTVLYSIISEHYPHFVQEIELSGGYLPQFVRQEFEEYLKCGLLEHGFLLAALVPRPRLNLTRFHGVFAPNFKHRHKIVPQRPRSKDDSDKALVPMSWAQRLTRVFAIDIERCPECGGNVRVIACIEDPHLIAIILAHARGQEAATTKGVARTPPVCDGARPRLN